MPVRGGRNGGDADFMSPLISNENRAFNDQFLEAPQSAAGFTSDFNTARVAERISLIDKYKLKEIKEYTANELFKARAKT